MRDERLVRAQPDLQVVDCSAPSIFSDMCVDTPASPSSLDAVAPVVAGLAANAAGVIQALTSPASDQLYHILVEPRLAEGIAEGVLQWNETSVVIREVSNGRIAGQVSVEAAASASSAATLPLLVSNAAMHIQLAVINKKLASIDRRLNRVLQEMEIARRSELRGYIDCLGAALACADGEQRRAELTQLLPGLTGLAHESAALTDRAWDEALPYLFDAAQAVPPVRPLGRFRERHETRPELSDWTADYLATAEACWLAKLAVYAIRSALGQQESAAREYEAVVRFWRRRIRKLPKRLAPLLLLKTPRGNIPAKSWLDSALSELEDKEDMQKIVREVCQCAEGALHTIDAIRQPELVLTVKPRTGLPDGGRAHARSTET